MLRYRVRAVVLIGTVCVFAAWGTTVRSQGTGESNDAKTEVKDVKSNVKEAILEVLQPAKPPDPNVATTTKDLKIPLDELKVLIKPLTLEELQNEAVAWAKLLRKKAQEISDAEVTVKRQNQSISKKKEGADALDKAKQALEEAEKAQKGASPGSPQYQEATKKVEEAKEHLKEAQEAVEKAKTSKAAIKQDDKSRKVLEKAKKAGDLETAKQTLDKLKADRDKMTSGSPAYEAATKTVDKLDTAIKAVEKATEAHKSSKPDSPEYKDTTQKLEKANVVLKQILNEIGGASTTQSSSEKSSQTLNNATANLQNTEIKSNGDQKVAGLPGVANNQQNLKEKQQNLKKTSEQLQKSADAESEVKNQLVVTVTELNSQLTAITDRFNVILDELDKKGGDSKSYRKYIQSVTSVEVDAKDTQGTGFRFLRWLQSEEGGLRWANNAGKFTGIVIVSIVISQILGMLLNQLLSRFGGTSSIMRQFVVMVVKRGGVVIGFLVALTALEVSLGPVLALLGGVTFVLAFALQSNLGNLASGLMIMVYKPFDVGDEIKLGKIWGWVDSITLANTRIKGFGGQIFSLPNNTVWNDTIENLSCGKTRKIMLSLRIDFGEDLTRVEQLLVDIMKSHPDVLEDPAPTTFVWSVEEYYISVFAGGWAKTEVYWTTHEEVIRMIQDRFHKEGISLAAIPRQNVHLQKETKENGSTPHFVSDISVPQRTDLVSESPKDMVDVIDVEKAEVR